MNRFPQFCSVIILYFCCAFCTGHLPAKSKTKQKNFGLFIMNFALESVLFCSLHIFPLWFFFKIVSSSSSLPTQFTSCSKQIIFIQTTFLTSTIFFTSASATTTSAHFIYMKNVTSYFPGNEPFLVYSFSSFYHFLPLHRIKILNKLLVNWKTSYSHTKKIFWIIYPPFSDFFLSFKAYLVEILKTLRNVKNFYIFSGALALAICISEIWGSVQQGGVMFFLINIPSCFKDK